MKKARFSLNAFILVIIIFSAVIFFVTISLVDLANPLAVNERYPVEGTDLAVVYSNRIEHGLYEGPANTAVLRLPGRYGHDWGMAREGSALYMNEYLSSDIRLTYCRLVRVDLDTFEKQVIADDAVLRGRCASGELVYVSGQLLPSVYPETSVLARLYMLSAPAAVNGAVIKVMDPVSGDISVSASDPKALSDGDLFDSLYIDRTLDEILEWFDSEYVDWVLEETAE